MPDETPTPEGCDGPGKAVAWSAPLTLADLGRWRGGCSVHALMLSCVAAALAGELRSRGQDPRRAELRLLGADAPGSHAPAQASAGKPLRPRHPALPLGIANPVARSWECSAASEALTGSRQALLMHVLLSLVGLLAEPWHEGAGPCWRARRRESPNHGARSAGGALPGGCAHRRHDVLGAPGLGTSASGFVPQLRRQPARGRDERRRPADPQPARRCPGQASSSGSCRWPG